MSPLDPQSGAASPEAAEAAFYAAFQRGSLEAMMAVWAPNGPIECIHPLGERLRGALAIRESWRAIFEDSPPLRLHIAQRQVLRSDALAVHIVHEHVGVGDAEPNAVPIVATNVYRLDARGWHMVLHHASPMRAAPLIEPPPEQVH